MTDAQKKKQATEYQRLEKLIDREKEKRFSSQAVIASLEDKMAGIETAFQKADADISLWLE